MKIKRGIFCGIIVMLGSVSGICEMYSMRNITACGIYTFALLLGVIQFIMSFRYDDQVKKRILLLCFGIEGIYCAAAMIRLLRADALMDVKIFGVIVAIIYLSLILSSVYTLCGDNIKVIKG